MGGRFFIGVLIGYTLKNLIKIVFIIVGLFFAAVAYLHYHQIATLNWNKLQTVSEDAIIALSKEILYWFQVLALVIVVVCP